MAEWDHYLSQDLYAEFSALPCNLIPSCSICNRRKKETSVADGQRCFIHFYFDQFDHQRELLRATLTVTPPELPQVRFEIASAEDAFARLFAEHCRRLDLCARFASKAREAIASLAVTLRRRKQAPLTEIAADLELRAKDEAGARGANHWSAVFYRTVARTPTFLEYCRSMP